MGTQALQVVAFRQAERAKTVDITREKNNRTSNATANSNLASAPTSEEGTASAKDATSPTDLLKPISRKKQASPADKQSTSEDVYTFHEGQDGGAPEDPNTAKGMQMYLRLLQRTNEEGLDVTPIIKLMMNHRNPPSVIDTQSKTVVDDVSKYGEQHSTAARQPFETSAGLLQRLKQGPSNMAFISQPQAQALLVTAHAPSLVNLAGTVPTFLTNDTAP